MIPIKTTIALKRCTIMMEISRIYYNYNNDYIDNRDDNNSVNNNDNKYIIDIENAITHLTYLYI